MLSLIWGWIWNWLLGWGGIGGVVCIAAWAAWWFSPVFKSTLLHIAIGATVFVFSASYFFTSGYNKGYQVAIHAVAAKDKRATDEADKARGTVQDCFNSGGTWDVASASCLREQ